MDYVQNDILDYHSFQTPPGLWGLAEEQIKQLQANFSLPKLYKHYIRTIWIHTSCFQLELKFKTVYCHQSLNTDRYFCEPLDEILGHCSARYVTGDVCLQRTGWGIQNPKGHGCMVPPRCLPVPSITVPLDVTMLGFWLPEIPPFWWKCPTMVSKCIHAFLCTPLPGSCLTQRNFLKFRSVKQKSKRFSDTVRKNIFIFCCLFGNRGRMPWGGGERSLLQFTASCKQ